MWTLVAVVTLLIATGCQASFDASPSDPQNVDNLLECMLPGAGGQPVQEPLQIIYLEPAGASDCWNLSDISVKAPFGDIDSGRLDGFLNASMEMEQVTSRTMPTGMAPDPNDVFNTVVEPLEVPYLEGFSSAEQNVIQQYVAAADIGSCTANFVWQQRPDFYYPPYQVQGKCTGTNCGLPSADDHNYGQFCRPDAEDTIRIRALRWDCCYSFTTAGSWEYVCGWRMVSVPIIRQCQCSCDALF